MDEATPKILGPWTLGEELGNGGNATVWRATRPELEKPVALKVIHTHRENKEPYKRFVAEINFLRSLKVTKGVLPLLDAYLPDRPSKEDRPWLAMPIATLISDALADKPLETVVRALSQIAATLSRLAELKVGHRDIKPNNLYRLKRSWLVGDFGLIAAPDRDELTQAGRPLGPAHYAAYELILNPATADPLPADVYSFGKTLWVLATRQAFPPQGHQPAGTRQFSIADLRPHPRAGLLDQLVDRATRIHPAQRPTMAEIAADLKAWSGLAEEPVAYDVSSLRARLLEELKDELSAEEQLKQNKEFALDAVKSMNRLFVPLNTALKGVHPGAEIDLHPDRYTQNMLSTRNHFGSLEIEFKFQRLSRIATGSSRNQFALRLGRSLELAETGDLVVRSYVNVGYLETMGGDGFDWHSDEWTAPAGSVQVELVLQEAADETGKQLMLGLEAFADYLAKRG